MSEHLQLKDYHSEVRIVSLRVMWVVFFVLVMMGVLMARYYKLQITDHEDYATQSDSNRIHVQPIPPTRGLIFDRNGVLLAENRPSFTLSIIKERVVDMSATLATLEKLVDISDDDLERFYSALEQRRKPFEAVSLRFSLTEAEKAKLAVNKYRLPGVEVEAKLVRHYPYGELFTHSIGRVGRIDQNEAQRFTEEEYKNYRGTDIIGKIGLEKYYEKKLLGKVGTQYVETNARGRVLKELDRDNPNPGQDLHLYMDIEVQKTAFEKLGDRRGAVVAIDVNTGGVVAMVSKPSYDPNLFVTGISHQNYNMLRDSQDDPFVNRAIQGQYSPGSVIKPMLGLAGLHYGVIDYDSTVRDKGYYQLEGEERLWRDWQKGGHGKMVDLHQAVVESCNIFFYDLAFNLTIDRIYEFGRKFGLGQLTGIDIPNEKSGLWPSRAWKRETTGLPWYPGETLNAGIGQGDVILTPLQMVVMTAMLANHGKLLQPKLVNQEQKFTEFLQPSMFELPMPNNGVGLQVDTNNIKAEHWEFIAKAMVDVVASVRGTASGERRGIFTKEYSIAAKTGTAQLVEIAQEEDEIIEQEPLDERKKNQALFVSYAPADDPKLAVMVIIENGEHGSYAGPIARAVFDSYFASERKRSERAESKELTRAPNTTGFLGTQLQVGSRAN